MAAIFWIGGMLFLMLVIAPFLATIDDPKKKSEIYQVVGTKFRFWGWVAIIILLVTGPLNLFLLGVSKVDLLTLSFYGSPYGKALLVKLMFVVMIVMTSLLHDFWLGPRARNTPGFLQIARVVGRGNFILALFIVLFAVILRTGGF